MCCWAVAIPDTDEHNNNIKDFQGEEEGVWNTISFQSTSKNYRKLIQFLKKILIQMLNNTKLCFILNTP